MGSHSFNCPQTVARTKTEKPLSFGSQVAHDLAGLDGKGRTSPVSWTDFDAHLTQNARGRERIPRLDSVWDLEIHE